MTSCLHHIECAQCHVTWMPDERDSAMEHTTETLHDLQLVMVYVHRLDAIAMWADGVNPEDVVDDIESATDQPDDNDPEVFEGYVLDTRPERYDDGGVPTLLLTLVPHRVPLAFFGQAMRALADITPEESVMESTERGYELWSRPPN